MKKYIYTSLTLLIGLFLLGGCVSEQFPTDGPTGDANQKMVNFVVSVSGAQKSMTRALTEENENTVKTIEVLLFDQDGVYTHMPIFNDQIVQKPNGELSFTIKVPVGTFNMLVIANSRSAVLKLMNQISAGSTRKQVVLDKLLLENPSMWVIDGNQSDYKHIPMSGEIPKLVVSGDKPIVQGVTLVRMLSKIEVKLSDESKGNFDLKNIYLYNFSEKGKIAPDTKNWNSDFNAVVTASLPVNYQSAIGSSIFYNESMIQKVGNRGVGCENVIYTPESAQGTGNNDMDKNICLVLGGVYEGDVAPTYYRVDIANNTNGVLSYMEVKRNHQYVMLIKKVSGPGFTDPETALKSRPVNIEANVVEWNHGGLDDVTFDGQHLLSVSQSEFVFGKSERTTESKDNSLFITTDYPTGWIIDKIVDQDGKSVDWLSLSVTKGAAQKTETKLLLLENRTNESRKGFIHIAAGRLKYIVSVEQLTTSDLSLLITDEKDIEVVSLDFISVDGLSVPAQKFKVQWTPIDSPLSTILTPYLSGGFLFDKNSGNDVIVAGESLLGGEKRYTIKPQDFSTEELQKDPFQVRSSILVYSLMDNGASLSKTMMLNHRALNLVHYEKEVYDLDGGTHEFYIRSNMPYTVEVKNDELSVFTLQTTSGDVDTSEKGSPIYFDLILDDEGRVGKTVVTLLVKSPTNQFKPQEVMINCISAGNPIKGPANCYMLQPGGKGIRIPVGRCNEWINDAADPSKVYKLGNDEEFDVKLLWTDNSNGIAANSNIKELSVQGTGTDGYINIEPGSGEGNAVVAMISKSGVILWSWHIWVTDYIPNEDIEYMDRNLGAFANNANDKSETPRGYGLYYQWGRKDPFPGASQARFEINSFVNTYDALGNKRNMEKQLLQAPVSSNNIHVAVMNPDNFYYTKSGIKDWCVNIDGGIHNNALWVTDKKTIYDPCPAGWKINSENLSKEPYYFNPFINIVSINVNKGGVYFIAGSMDRFSGLIVSVTTSGWHWTSNAGNTNVFIGGGSGASGIRWVEKERASGLPVRCVRYDD